MLIKSIHDVAADIAAFSTQLDARLKELARCPLWAREPEKRRRIKSVQRTLELMMPAATERKNNGS